MYLINTAVKLGENQLRKNNNAMKRLCKCQEISSSIKELEATGNWNFAFIGADIDAWGAASRLNMQQSRVYSSQKANIKETMNFAAEALENSILLKKSGKNWEGFSE